MESILVSILVPVYNVEKYLDRCISSILRQTYSNIEILLINDGSTDNSLDICKRHEQLDSRIRVFSKPNGGLSDARNIGIAKANGQFLMFVDSDDYIHPEFVYCLLNTVMDNNSNLGICTFVKEFENGHHETVELPSEKTCINKIEAFQYLSESDGWTIVPAWNKIYNSKLWTKYSFPKGRLHEDEFVIHHILDQCDTIALCHVPLYHYVQREGSIMSTKTIHRQRDKIDAFIDRLLYFEAARKDELVSMVLVKLVDLVSDFARTATSEHNAKDFFYRVCEIILKRQKLLNLRNKAKMAYSYIEFTIKRLTSCLK